MAGTDQGLHGEAERDPNAFVIESRLPGGERLGPARIRARVADLDAAARGADFFRYAAGTPAAMVARFGVSVAPACPELAAPRATSSASRACPSRSARSSAPGPVRVVLLE
ncbi:MAG: hypothetical protein R3263_11290, partial [Myxococcota bacterium]|nr:hypothetical protein [Myxococcota bacterium]